MELVREESLGTPCNLELGDHEVWLRAFEKLSSVRARLEKRWLNLIRWGGNS